jgi:hypothetical protein
MTFQRGDRVALAPHILVTPYGRRFGSRRSTVTGTICGDEDGNDYEWVNYRWDGAKGTTSAISTDLVHAHDLRAAAAAFLQGADIR